MEREMIDALIDKYTQMMSIKQIRNTRKLTVFFFFLNTCLLLTIKCYIFTAVLFGLLIAEIVYLSLMLKRNMTIYRGVGVSVIVCGNTALFFNVALYSVPNLINVYDPTLLIIIFLVELLCLITGFFYTRRCVNKGTVRKPQVAAVASIAYLLPGAGGYVLANYINNNASVHIQGIFFTTAFALGSSMMMFILGMAHVSILYYIKKYNITDRVISNTDEVPLTPPSSQ